MPNTTMTLALDGEVPLDLFARAIDHFGDLVAALTKEIRPKSKIDWLIEDLASGSARTTIRGESLEADAVEPIVAAYLVVGRALAEGKDIPFSPRVARDARGIVDVLNGKITSIRFETEEDDATVSGRSGNTPRPSTVGAYGVVEGRVQTLTNRMALRFTLYDVLHDRAVSCYVPEGRQDLMREAWGRRAIVEGWVTRDAATGRPLSVRRVQSITLIDDISPGSIVRTLRGIAPIGGDCPSAVEAIRRLRDA